MTKPTSSPAMRTSTKVGCTVMVSRQTFFTSSHPEGSSPRIRAGDYSKTGLIGQRHIQKPRDLGGHSPVDVVVKIVKALTGNQAGNAAVDNDVVVEQGAVL